MCKHTKANVYTGTSTAHCMIPVKLEVATIESSKVPYTKIYIKQQSLHSRYSKLWSHVHCLNKQALQKL